mgnify:FL=1
MDDTIDFDPTRIENLCVDEIKIAERIANELTIRLLQVQAVLDLSAEGCTIPFISRYRKERTGNLHELQVRDCIQKFQSYKNLEERRLEVIKGISAMGKLDAFLHENILRATTLTELEDLWSPFKKKKKTRGMLAQEKGLAPFAELMERTTILEEVVAAATSFIHRNEEHPELSVESAEDALSGARDILAERLSQDTSLRAHIKRVFIKEGDLAVKGIGDEEKRGQSTYQMYWDYREPLSTLKHHRVLAINRGEREGELDVSIEVSDELVEARMLELSLIHI